MSFKLLLKDANRRCKSGSNPFKGSLKLAERVAEFNTFGAMK